MYSTGDQNNRRADRVGPKQTRGRLLEAAAELIAELGWGRVTTRAIAARAGMPLGAVSYHFTGKQDLLVTAAVHTVEQMFPQSTLEALDTLEDLVSAATAWMTDRDGSDPVTAGVLLEAMRESTRDETLREQIAAALTGYRRRVAELIAGECARASDDAAANSAATLFVAASDGLWLHALLDPHLDVAAAADILRAVVHQQTSSGS